MGRRHAAYLPFGESLRLGMCGSASPARLENFQHRCVQKGRRLYAAHGDQRTCQGSGTETVYLPFCDIPRYASLDADRAFAESYGFSFSANDLSYMDRTNISGYIAGLGDGYIDFYVEFNEYLRDMFFSRNNLTISITCQAIANVAGNLSVERII